MYVHVWMEQWRTVVVIVGGRKEERGQMMKCLICHTETYSDAMIVYIQWEFWGPKHATLGAGPECSTSCGGQLASRVWRGPREPQKQVQKWWVGNLQVTRSMCFALEGWKPSPILATNRSNNLTRYCWQTSGRSRQEGEKK